MLQKYKWFLLAGALLIALIYSNGLKAPLYFDDLAALNPSTKIDHLSLAAVVRAYQAMKIPNRPVSDLSLLLDRYLSPEGSSWLFHLNNLAIHILNFVFIFLFLQKLLSLPAVSSKYRDKSAAIAFAAAILWAVHPLQTQSVTYIVQRMSSLCALFYILSLYFYLRGRTEKRRAFYALSAIGFLLALGSKEIAATLPFAVLLIEGLFFQVNKKRFTAIVLAALLILAVASALFVGPVIRTTIDSLKNNKYANRPYLISERLLTEPRVFLHYISLTIFPWHSRYILDYDFPVSKGLFKPASTFFGLVFLIGTIVGAALLAKKNRIIAFGILAFWLGHAIEGSIFNLEIAFEHRMYLPSVFLILVIAVLGMEAMARIRCPRKLVAAVLGAVVLFLAIQTVLRNELWKDPERFYLHNIEMTPDNYRPYHNLGVFYGTRENFATALSYFNKALSKARNVSTIYAGVGQAQFGLKNYQEAAANYAQAIQMGLSEPIIYVNLATSYLRLEKYEEAMAIAKEGMKSFPEDTALMVNAGSLYYVIVQTLGNKGEALLRKSGFSEAQAFSMLDTAYARGNRDADLYVNLPPAYVKAAQIERSPERQSAWLRQAEAVALEGTKAHPERGDIRKNLIGIYTLTGRWQKILDLPSLNRDEYNQLVIYLLNAGQFREAEDVLKKAAAVFGMDQITEFNLAVCAFYLGRGEDAAATFKRIIATTSSPGAKFQAGHFLDEWEKSRVRK